MKKSPFENALMQNLRPSKFSGEGFLGTDSRSVDEIIREDLRFLGQHRISKEDIVTALIHAYEKAKEAFGAEVVIRPGVTAVFNESMGRVPSPFTGDGVFEKGEAVIRDAKRDHTMNVTHLGIHLIKKYGFFQGMGSRYRVEPWSIIKTFGLQPNLES